MWARVAGHCKIHVFSNGELAPFSREWYFEHLETAEPLKKWRKKTLQDREHNATQIVDWLFNDKTPQLS